MPWLSRNCLNCEPGIKHDRREVLSYPDSQPSSAHVVGHKVVVHILAEYSDVANSLENFLDEDECG